MDSNKVKKLLKEQSAQEKQTSNQLVKALKAKAQKSFRKTSHQ
jgi:hypothetical protein